MNKITKFFPLLLLSAGALAGCGEVQNDVTQLNVVVHDASWGTQWIYDAKDIWEAANPGYSIKITATNGSKALILSNLSSSKNTDDLYISNDATWKIYAASGKLATLDDLMEEEVDGVKFRNKINDEFERTLDFADKNGEKHVYRLPWASGMGGIYYNAKLFRDNGWEVPTTTDELITLVNTINEHPVAVPGDRTEQVRPFVYSGLNTDVFDYTVFNWWLQKSGYDKVHEFYNYESSSAFNYKDESSAYHGLYEAVKVWYDLYKNPNNSVKGSLSYEMKPAYNDFYNGKAAMIFDGDWIYNDILQKGENPNFELQYMKTPTISGAVETDSAYVIGSDQFIAVPESSIKKDLAKSFIKTLVSDQCLTNFVNKSHGFMAYKIIDQSGVDKSNAYVANYLKIRNEITKTTTDASESRFYLNDNVSNAWVKSPTRPFLTLLQSETATVESCFDSLLAAAKTAFGN